MTDEFNGIDGISRRTALHASAAGLGAIGLAGAVTATDDEDDDDYDDGAEEEMDDDEMDEEEMDDPDVDEPEGFEVEILGEHAPFVDDVAATFEITYPDADEPIVVEFDDAATVVVGEVTWDAGARSGWHRHPGMSIVQMVEGEIEHTMEDDCVPRTYSAGDAWIDPGHVHKADSEDGAFARVTFLGTPEGEPLTEWVEPVDC